jgi:hypothetical protein
VENAKDSGLEARSQAESLRYTYASSTSRVSYYFRGMHPLPPEHFTRRNLPHYTPNDAPYFVTFRLAGTISKLEAARLKALLADKSPESSRKFFRTYDTILDSARIGPKYLRQPEIMQQMHDTLRHASELPIPSCRITCTLLGRSLARRSWEK